MHSVPRGSPREKGESPPVFFTHYVLIDTRRAIQNRFITKLFSVGHRGFALGRGRLLGIAVVVRLD